MNFIKNNLLSLIVIVLFLLFMVFNKGQLGCNKGTRTPDTVRTVITQYIPQPQVTVPQYQPIIVESRQPTVIPQNYQPAQNYEALLKQYQDVINKLLSINVSTDSVELKDTTGTKVGIVNIKDQLQENRIKARDVSYKLWFPQTTITTTITKYDPAKRQFYFGGSLISSTSNILSGVGVDLQYKDKRDRQYGIGAGWLMSQKEPYFKITSLWKISLSKK